MHTDSLPVINSSGSPSAGSSPSAMEHLKTEDRNFENEIAEKRKKLEILKREARKLELSIKSYNYKSTR